MGGYGDGGLRGCGNGGLRVGIESGGLRDEGMWGWGLREEEMIGCM